MHQAHNDKRRRRSLAALLGASLLAGCQPDGAGMIAVNRQDPAVRRFKNLEDVKRPGSAKGTRKPGTQRAATSSDFR